jgi:DNA-binding MarR family transcriptional regulator
MTDNDPRHSYGYQTRAAYRAFDRLLSQRLKPHGIKNGFWYVLRVLWEGDGMSQREVATAVNLTESTTKITLDAMEEAGLVRRRRDSADRRRLRIYLAPRAKRLKAKLLPLASALNAAAAQGISKQDLGTYLKVTRKMQDNLRSARLKGG